MKTTLFILVVFLIILCGFAFKLVELPNDKSTLFAGSGNCTSCHAGSDGVLINAAGRDVSPVFHWQSSMMGNSAKDPYWQAKVSSEVEENPHLQEIIEDKCATCHAPMGRTEAIYLGHDSYSFSEVKEDPLSLDGVSCTVCHQIDADKLTTSESFSGNYVIEDTKTIYGPYENPFTTSMINNTGYTPTFGNHIESSGLCATCHTLITPYVDENGEVAGTFPEQMPYFEWLNSIYPAEEMTCQRCHMPRVYEDFTIASIPSSLQNKRNPVFEHHFVGGNLTVNQLISDNYTELGINSEMANLDTTAHYTEKNLKENTIEITTNASFEDTMVTVIVDLKNKTGHKLPTGFPSRRIWIHFVATDNNDITIFESGNYDENGEIITQEGLEEHHDTIKNESEVQIYEAVLGDTKNEVTTVLLKAAKYLKDNRLPPEGFKTGRSYDSLIAITGAATDDINFNKDELGEHGTGADKIYYRFPFSGNTLNYRIEICYQSIKPNFVGHLAESSTDESMRFTQMHSNENVNKVHIISQTVEQLLFNNISKLESKQWSIYPNPSKDFIYLNGEFIWPLNYSIYTLNGKLISKEEIFNPYISLKNIPRGTYILKINSKQVIKTFKLVRN